MYKRKIEDILLNWKNNPRHKPLVIKGVRQCGKTSSVKQFARQHYENVVYLDFREDPNLIPLFDDSLKEDYLTLLFPDRILCHIKRASYWMKYKIVHVLAGL